MPHTQLTRRRFLKGSVAFGLAVAAGGAYGCSGGSQNDQAAQGSQGASSQKTDWQVTDQADVTSTVSVPVERMVVLQHHSIDILAQLGATDKIVGVESKWRSDLGDYMTTVYPGITDVPTPGTLSEWNIEAIMQLNPDVVIAASQAPQDAMQQIHDAGIPVITVSLRGEGKQDEAQNPRLSDADKAYTDGCEWAVRTLGTLTGNDERADLLWNTCETNRSVVEDAIGTMDDDQRVRAFVANPDSRTYGNDKYVGCQLLRAGAINVAAADIQGYKEYSMDALYGWDPDVIIVQDRYPQVYQQVTEDPAYQQLRAVRDGNVIVAPYWTKPWGNPDADSIALGELWLAHTFYPDKVSADTVQKAAVNFYQTFYGVPFTDQVQ